MILCAFQTFALLRVHILRRFYAYHLIFCRYYLASHWQANIAYLFSKFVFCSPIWNPVLGLLFSIELMYQDKLIKSDHFWRQMKNEFGKSWKEITNNLYWLRQRNGKQIYAIFYNNNNNTVYRNTVSRYNELIQYTTKGIWKIIPRYIKTIIIIICCL